MTQFCQFYLSNMSHIWPFLFLFLPPGMWNLLLPGIEPVPPVVEAWSPNHWTAREVWYIYPPFYGFSWSCHHFVPDSYKSHLTHFSPQDLLSSIDYPLCYETDQISPTPKTLWGFLSMRQTLCWNMAYEAQYNLASTYLSSYVSPLLLYHQGLQDWNISKLPIV